MVHLIKSDAGNFNLMKSGEKAADIRYNDKNFLEGDVLAVNEYDYINKRFTGRHIIFEITDVKNDICGLSVGYVLLKLKPI